VCPGGEVVVDGPDAWVERHAAEQLAGQPRGLGRRQRLEQYGAGVACSPGTSGELSAELVDRGGQRSVDQVGDLLPPLVGGVGMYKGDAVVAGERQQLLRDGV